MRAVEGVSSTSSTKPLADGLGLESLIKKNTKISINIDAQCFNHIAMQTRLCKEYNPNLYLFLFILLNELYFCCINVCDWDLFAKKKKYVSRISFSSIPYPGGTAMELMGAVSGVVVGYGAVSGVDV